MDAVTTTGNQITAPTNYGSVVSGVRQWDGRWTQLCDERPSGRFSR